MQDAEKTIIPTGEDHRRKRGLGFPNSREVQGRSRKGLRVGVSPKNRSEGRVERSGRNCGHWAKKPSVEFHDQSPTLGSNKG